MIKKIFSIAIIATLAGISLKAEASNVAVVDLQKVYANSSQVKALKKEQENKRMESEKQLKSTQQAIQQIKDPAQRKAKIQAFDKELRAKREAEAKAYRTKQENIGKSIDSAIIKQAKAMGYDLILTKSAVIYGGDDITESVLKVVK